MFFFSLIVVVGLLSRGRVGVDFVRQGSRISSSSTDQSKTERTKDGQKDG